MKTKYYKKYQLLQYIRKAEQTVTLKLDNASVTYVTWACERGIVYVAKEWSFQEELNVQYEAN